MACEPINNGPMHMGCCPPGCPQSDPNFGELRFEVFDQPLGGFFDVGWMRSNTEGVVSHWKFTLTRKYRIVRTAPSPTKCADGITDNLPPGSSCVGAQSCRATAAVRWYRNDLDFGTWVANQGFCFQPGDPSCVIPCTEEDNPSSVVRYAQVNRCYMLRIQGGPADPTCVPREYFGCVLEAINPDKPFLIAEWVAGPVPPP